LKAGAFLVCGTVSRILLHPVGTACHLSYLPTPCASPEAIGRVTQFTMKRNVHGISTRKVCPISELLPKFVRSYRTFSPLPRKNRGSIVSVTLSVSRRCATPFIKRYGTLRCPDFPHPRRRCDRPSHIPFLQQSKGDIDS